MPIEVEPRVPLSLRVNSVWTTFEAKLFNLITENADHEVPGYFSSRLWTCEQMLEVFDRCVRKLSSGWSPYRPN